MRIRVICLLDKADPPDHSFVSGMLAGELCQVPGMHVTLIVSEGSQGQRLARYHSATCLPILARHGSNQIAKIGNVARAACRIAGLIRRSRRRGERVTLFVRNDPRLLLAAAVLRRKADRLIFQSSFPLEDSGSSTLRRWVHRNSYRLLGRGVDGALGVSPQGTQRIVDLIGRDIPGLTVPLLSDFPSPASPTKRRLGDPIRYIYIGTHDVRRELDVVLRGVILSLKLGAHAEFHFVGGSKTEIAALRAQSEVVEWESRGAIKFIGKVERSRIPLMLRQFDVGLCLIPPKPLYREASPTKLAEYLGQGLAVLASEGIPLQENVVSASRAGLLIKFESTAIEHSVRTLDGDRLAIMKENALEYAAAHLRYQSYVEDMAAALWPTSTKACKGQ